jgi:hypothetical protein
MALVLQNADWKLGSVVAQTLVCFQSFVFVYRSFYGMRIRQTQN